MSEEALGKVVTQDELIFYVAQHKRNGQRVVFTNGCFDLLHPGHIQDLEGARSLGDLLIVGINSDASVRRLKGPSRPVIPEGERAEILSALESVSYAVLFDEATPLNLILRVRPDFLVKGGNWQLSEIVGRAEVESYGGTVMVLPVVPGFSTTAIIKRIRSAGPRS